jgi:hypothetical protein
MKDTDQKPSPPSEMPRHDRSGSMTEECSCSPLVRNCVVCISGIVNQFSVKVSFLVMGYGTLAGRLT